MINPNKGEEKFPIWNHNASLLFLCHKEILSNLKSQGFNNLYIDGGLVIQSFLAEDLINELIVTRIPILLGGGIPLFGELSKPLKFVHWNTEM